MGRAREDLFVHLDKREDSIEAAAALRDREDETASLFERLPHAGAKEKLRAFLEANPAGTDANELIRLLFKGAGSDPDLRARLVHGILDGDPNFIFDAATGLWSLRSHQRLRAPLDEAHFVVVDLETTGGRPAPGAIIEIGAYRMRGRQILDSFQSLLRPRMRIPPFIVGLTSITNEMVADAPPIEDVLPAFRDFLGDAVLVAHNAQFDRSFLDFEFRRLFGIGLLNPVLCTLRMARRFLPSLKRRRLDLLAEHFGLSTAGRHRGLGDARMAAELLSIFLETAAGMGLNRLDRLIDHHYRGMAGRRIERHIPPETITAMPRTPGVYLMRNERGDLLYIGKAARLRDRVASYFNGGDSLNAKTAELVSHVWSIETRGSRSALEAALIEARLIRELKPPYNRMLKSAAPAFFLKIDQTDPFPRIQVARKLTHKAGMLQVGPFIGRRNLDNAASALSRLLGLRTCGGRLHPDEDFSPCVYGQMGHCASPCNQTITREEYARQAAKAVAFLRGRGGALMGDLARARDDAAAAMRFEEARRHHRDLEALATLSNRAERLSRVVTENNLVIVTQSADDVSSSAPAIYVVLSGRLALTRDVESREAAEEIAAFIAGNFDGYRLRPVARGELEEMSIVARWLKERAPDDGKLIYLNGPTIGADTILAACSRQGS